MERSLDKRLRIAGLLVLVIAVAAVIAQVVLRRTRQPSSVPGRGISIVATPATSALVAQGDCTKSGTGNTSSVKEAGAHETGTQVDSEIADKRLDVGNPALKSTSLAALLDEPHDSNSESIEDALSRIMASEDITEDAEALLLSQNRNAFLLGVRALAVRGNPDDVIRVVEIIENAKDEDLRRDVVVAACGIQNASAAPILFEIIKTAKEPEYVDMAQRSLGGMPGSGALLQSVEEYRASESDEQRERFLGVIRCTSQTGAVSFLEQIVGSSQSNYGAPLSVAAIDTLALLGTGEAVNSLLNWLAASPESVKLAAAVGRVSSPDALQTLLRTVNEVDGPSSWPVKVASARALGNYADKEVERVLVALTQQPDIAPEMREAVGASLLKVHGDYGTDFSK